MRVIYIMVLGTTLAILGCHAASPPPGTGVVAAGGKADGDGAATGLHVKADCNFGSLASLGSDYTELLLDVDLAARTVHAGCTADPDGCSLDITPGDHLDWAVVGMSTFGDAAPIISADPNETTVKNIYIEGGNGDDTEFALLLVPNDDGHRRLAAQATLIVQDGQYLHEISAVTACTLELVGD